MTFKEEISKILRDHGLPPSDAPNVFEAISEILTLAADNLIKNVPYATNSIQILQRVSASISDYDDFIQHYSYS